VQERGVTLWFTGLSGSGKSTLANILVERLRAAGRRVELLDGDEVRTNLTSDLGFSKEDRDEARAETNDFVEIFVDCPLEVCAQRDVKGLYAKAMRGEIPHFTGVSDPYEPPTDAEITIHSDKLSPDESIDLIFERLGALGYVVEEYAAV